MADQRVGPHHLWMFVWGRTGDAATGELGNLGRSHDGPDENRRVTNWRVKAA